MSDLGLRATSVLGLCAFIGIAWALSTDRSKVRWATVRWGIGLQLAIALVLLVDYPFLGDASPKSFFFGVASVITEHLLAFTNAGTRFVFGPLMDTGFSFALNVLPVIVFMGSIFAVLYHLNAVQPIVRALARLLSRGMRLSGAESLAAVANVFVGMVESMLVIKPYVERMTRSELFCTMNLGMATVAGSVLLAYVGMLGGGEFAGHLVTASLLSAPAGILIAKIMVPESEKPASGVGEEAMVPSESVNVIDAAAAGALGGLRLAAYVGAMLLAFVALIAMLNALLGGFGDLLGVGDLTFQRILGWLMAPFALLMGVPWSESTSVGSLLGIKTVLNEFLAYQQLSQAVEGSTLSVRSQIIASYALCGFANFGSLAILLGGIQTIAPGRRHEAASLGLRSIVGGSLATFMTGCVAGLFL